MVVATAVFIYLAHRYVEQSYVDDEHPYSPKFQRRKSLFETIAEIPN